MSLSDRIAAAAAQQKAEREAAATDERAVMHYAARQVFDGATPVEADCLLDHITDLGWRLERSEAVS